MELLTRTNLTRLMRSLFLLSLLLAALAACNREEETPAPTPEVTTAPSSPTATDSTPGVEQSDTGADAPQVEVAPNGPVEPATGEQPPAPTTNNESATPQPTGEIVLWHSWAGAEGDALAQILAGFNQRYPGVTVQTLFVAHDDLLQSYAEAVLAEGGPTLLLAPNWWLAEMVLLQLVTPLGPELAQSTRDGLYPAALDSMVWQGELYGLPVSLTVPALYINTDLYAGPPPASLDELYTLASADPAQGIGLYANLYHLAWGLSAFDVSLFEADGRIILDQSSGTVEFLAWLHAIDQLEGSFVDQDYGMLQDRFQKGEFAFFVDGPWSAGQFNAALNGALQIAPIPAGPGGPAAPWVYSDGLFLNPNSDDAARRLAVTLTQHLASPDTAEILATAGNLIPANRQLSLDSTALLSGFHAQASTSQAMPTRPEMDTVWGYGGDLLLRALLGYPDLDSDARQAAYAELAAEISTLINEANGR